MSAVILTSFMIFYAMYLSSSYLLTHDYEREEKDVHLQALKRYKKIRN